MPVVRVSDELFREVQEHAEPLVDKFETVPRKILRSKGHGVQLDIGQPSSREAETGTHSREFWRLILEVLVEKGGRTRRAERTYMKW